jgi:hypothetical protein
MNLEQEKRHLEVACQQILLTDASVYSVQWLDLPARYASQVTASLLLDRYLEFVRNATWHLIRPTVTGEGVQFRLLSTPLALLSFSPPQYHALEGGEEVQLSVCGGFLVQTGECDRGRFSLHSVPHEGGVRITVQLSDYCPLLLGSRTPSMIRKLLYRLTQAYIHKVVTVRYLSRLYRDLTGLKIRHIVKKVQVREGLET